MPALVLKLLIKTLRFLPLLDLRDENRGPCWDVHRCIQVFTRPLNFCIVDEVDSILLDESNQPLIMGFPTDDALLRARLEISDKIVTNLKGCPAYYASGEPIPIEIQEKYPGDFTTNVIASRKSLEFTDAGQEKVVHMLGRFT